MNNLIWNNKQLPSISIIARTLNTNISMFTRVLEAVKKQKYPKELIEYIVVDSGSTNGTIKLAKKYGCKVIENVTIGEDAQASIGIKAAKGDIILDLESDNIITSNDWFLKMVKPFMENKEVFFTYSAYNSYEKNMPATTRYCALFGSPDPVLYYLGKSEKLRLTEKKYNKGKIIKENSDYYVVEFNRENLPTLGANGCMFLRSAINKVNKDPIKFTHTDAVAEMLDLGYTTFGVVKNSIIHMANPSVMGLIKRKVQIKTRFYDRLRGKRKYLVFNPNSNKDRLKLILCVIFSLTIIEPLIESLRGYFKIRDKAWFLHPLVSFLMVVGYINSELKFILKNSTVIRPKD